MKYWMLFCLLSIGLVFACGSSSPTEDSNMARETQERPAPSADIDTFPYDLSYVMGQFDPATHPDFVAIDTKYADREGMYLHKDTYEAFQRMYAAAQAEGIRLTIRSAARNFDYQKGIWEGKWTGERKIENGTDAAKAYPDPKARALKILEYSSMPGSSRHHWGTDIDLISFSNEYFDKGDGKKAYDWLKQHAATYGFCQPYTAGRPFGYHEERWHWSYLPLAQPVTRLAQQQLRDTMIQGFAGAEVAPRIGIVKHYVLGINPQCLP